MSKVAIMVDMYNQIERTRQVYVPGHDIPVSISRHVYAMLDEKRKEVAKEIGVPEAQYEFEDLIAHLTGHISLEEAKHFVELTKEGRTQ